MRRSLWLVAAAFWLLQLNACGDQPAARTPHAARSPRAGRAPRPRNERSGPVAVQSTEPQENTGESPPRARDTNASYDTRATNEQLAQRFGKARALAVLHGSGSYYADKFAGRPTASGAPYEPTGFTAAHRTLPFGTVLRVTRVDGGQRVYVRVTDRGPFGPRGRILDLSRAAAAHLGMLRAGVAKLQVEVVEYGAHKSRRRKH
jgi:rare lipoprotein A